MDKKSMVDVVISVLVSCVVSLILLYVFHGMQRENFQGEFDEHRREVAKDFEKVSRDVVENKREIENLHQMFIDSGMINAKSDINKISGTDASSAGINMDIQNKDVVSTDQDFVSKVVKSDLSSINSMDVHSSPDQDHSRDDKKSVEKENSFVMPEGQDLGALVMPDMQDSVK